MNKKMKKYIALILLSLGIQNSISSIAIPIAIPVTQEIAKALFLIALFTLKGDTQKNTSLLFNALSQQKVIQDQERSEVSPDQIAQVITALEEGKIKCVLGKAKELLVTLPETEKSSSPFTFVISPIMNGIRVEAAKGIFLDVQFGQREVTRADLEFEKWLTETTDTLTAMELDPAYRNYVINKLNRFMNAILQTNSEVSWVRFYSRLALADLDKLWIEEPYRSHGDDVRIELLKHYFTARGHVRFLEQDKCMISAIKKYFKNIQLKKSAAEYQDSRLHPHGNLHNQNWLQIRKHTLSWGGAPGSSKLAEKIRNDHHNKVMWEILGLCQHYDFEHAKPLIQSDGLPSHYRLIAEETLKHYQEIYKKEAFDERGIYRQCLNDPLLEQLSKHEWYALDHNATHKEQFNEHLLLRHYIKNKMFEQWGIAQDAPMTVHKAIYSLIDKDGKSLSDLTLLLDQSINVTSDDTVQDHDKILSALFLPNGVFKDFAQYEHVRILEIPQTILSKEHVETREILNKLLYFEQVYKGSQRGEIAYRGIEYIQAYFKTTNEHDAAIYQKLFKQTYKTVVLDQDSIIGRLPDLSISYLNDDQKQVHRCTLSMVDALLTLKQTSNLKESLSNDAVELLVHKIHTVHELNHEGKWQQAEQLLSSLLKIDKKELKNLDTPSFLEKIKTNISKESFNISGTPSGGPRKPDDDKKKKKVKEESKKSLDRVIRKFGEQKTEKKIEEIKEDVEKTFKDTRTQSMPRSNTQGSQSYDRCPSDPIKREVEWAPKQYDNIRNNTQDIERISKNTGIPSEKVKQIKDHLFNNKHTLREGRIERFDPDSEVASTWHRLENGTHIKRDIDLLRHEYMESELEKNFDLPYEDAHNIAQHPELGCPWDF